MKKLLEVNILFYLLLLGVCVFVLLQSPLAPLAKSTNGVDSSVFIYSAQQILDGQLMYKDVVDHKGPFLYFINVMALLIFDGNFIGIWIFEVLSLFIASIMMYKTARFFADKVSSFVAVVTSILFLVPLLIGGNFTEEWALPYISIALYIFVSHLKNNTPLDILRLFILSFTFVLTFMLRANLVAIWVVFGIALLIKWITEKKYNELIRNVSFMLVFVLISLLPFFLYFCINNTLSDAVYLVLEYNMFEYAQKGTKSLIIHIASNMIGQRFLSVIPVIIVGYMLLKEGTIVNVGLLFAFVFSVLSCSLGISAEHYFMIFAPLIVIPHAYIFMVMKKNIPNAKYIYLLALFVFYNLDPIGRQVKAIYDNYLGKGYGLSTMQPSTMEELKLVITQNTSSTDKILVKGNQCSVYLYSGRKCATRFPFPLKSSSLSEEHYVKDAEEALPKLIIQGYIVNSWDNFTLENILNSKYQLIETDIEDVEIWKLKEK